VITTEERVPLSDFETATGWELKPEGACRGELCVHLPGSVLDQGSVNVIAVAEHLRMPVVRDQTRGILALGPAVLAGRQLETAVAPELVLPDVEGRNFSLSSLRGQKVLLLAWAPY
jgi:hypothetical protein